MYHGVGTLLLAAVAGYWVLEQALKHRGRMKQFGRILGALIITISLLGVVCRLAHISSGKYSSCFHAGKEKSPWSCPHKASQASPLPAATN